MKPIRTTLLAAMVAAISIAPLATAEAHKRHRGGEIAAAFALGLFAGHLHHRHSVYPKYRYRHCNNSAWHHHGQCHNLNRQYHGIPRGHYPSNYYHWQDDGAGGRIYNGR